MAASVTLSEWGWMTVIQSLSSDMSTAANAGHWATARAIAEQLLSIHKQRGEDNGVDHCRKLIASYTHLSDIDRKARKERQS